MTASCSTGTSNTILITLPAGVSFPSGTQNYFKFVSLITTSAFNATLLQDSTTYLADGTTSLETWTSGLTIVAAAFTSSSASTICVSAGLSTLLTLTFVPNIAIPAGVLQSSTNNTKGYLQFEFVGSSNDLGTGITTESSVPCQGIAGLTPSKNSVIFRI